MNTPAYQAIKKYSLANLKDTLKFYKETVDKTVKTSKYKTKMDIYNFLKSQNYEVGTIDMKIVKSKKIKAPMPLKAEEPKPPTAPLPISKPKAVTPRVSNNDINIIKRKNEGQFIPFVNRTVTNIDDREFYFKNLLKYLKVDVSSMNNCLEFTGFVNDNPTFKIGDNIIAKNQIGRPSAYGIVYLSSFKDSDNKPFEYATKIQLLEKEAKTEIRILETLREALLRETTPHFPYLYSVLYCDDVKKDFKDIPKDQFKKFPALLKKKKPIAMILNELANGDLKTFVNNNKSNLNLLKNAYIQVLISLFTFNMVTNSFHNDAHWGNFLYHKIKPGGYIHYRIQGVDYYLENLGYLWVIWDFGNIKPLNELGYHIDTDVWRVSGAFINKKDKEGWVIGLDKAFSNFNLTIARYIESAYGKKPYRPILMKEMIKYLFGEYSKANWVLKNPPANATIINSRPYIINF